jgi:hypothetical protein
LSTFAEKDLQRTSRQQQHRLVHMAALPSLVYLWGVQSIASSWSSLDIKPNGKHLGRLRPCVIIIIIISSCSSIMAHEDRNAKRERWMNKNDVYVGATADLSSPICVIFSR